MKISKTQMKYEKYNPKGFKEFLIFDIYFCFLIFTF